MQRSRAMSLALFGIAFTLSGGAGLVYESVWTRYLGLFVGHTAYAQVIVLATFLGGMSIGAWLAGRRTESLRDPVRMYAYAELGLAATGFVFHAVYGFVTDAAYTWIFPALPSDSLLVIVRWSIAVALILPQSILLGTTFPLMSAGVLRRFTDTPGRILSFLYFSNSIGAALALPVAGFYLLGAVGLPGTVAVAAILNVVASLLSLFASVLARRAEPATLAEPSRATEPGLAAARRPSRLLLWVALGTAVASFGYEIAWIRMLSLVLGAATHSFELMLSAFILGMALGARWIEKRADQIEDARAFLGIVQWIMGACAILTLPIYLASFDWMSWLVRSVSRDDGGYALFNLFRYALCFVVMVPATFCTGIVLPLITRTLVTEGGGERMIGQVYAVNTLGSIIGVVLASLVLMPWLGLKGLLVAAALLDMALGVLLLASASARPLWRAGAATAAAAIVVGAIATSVSLRPEVLSGGVFRYGQARFGKDASIVYYRDGRTATVSVINEARTRALYLSTNGKIDASVQLDWIDPGAKTAAQRSMSGDESAQVLVGLITLAHAEQAKRAAVVGQGSGLTSHFLLSDPAMESVTTIEIEPEMVRGSRLFYPANRRVFDDPRSRIVYDDGRSFLAASREKYDVIVSVPSNPWVSGVASLFTKEFYGRVRRALAPGGVFGQWMQVYEIDDGLVLSVLSAIHQTFSSYEIFLLNGSDLLIVAGTEAELPPPRWRMVEEATRATEPASLVPFTAEALEALRLAGRADFSAVLDGSERTNSDFFPVLDLGAERSRFLGRSATGFIALAADRAPIVRAASPLRLGLDVPYRPPIEDQFRLRRAALAAAIRGPGPIPWSMRPADRKALQDARFLWWGWREGIERGTPPPDWRTWVDETLRLEAYLHGPARGVVDTAFYESIRRYLDVTSAPAEARAAIEFARALRERDMAAASRACDPLLQAARSGFLWVRPEMLLDGGVSAKLAEGDAITARAILRDLGPRSRRSREDVRMRLLQAMVGSDADRREAAR